MFSSAYQQLKTEENLDAEIKDDKPGFHQFIRKEPLAKENAEKD
ncbi:3153_t:CDS:2 [Gigaspora margarita]|uniref:3153_t:CDS:1 n=1 Tax=Gigaspora margarita TaxID=4874 RepID=A0ABN7V6V4_GIGMA|nr:3153_t:CDS:2 [Gigaspora margarita]